MILSGGHPIQAFPVTPGMFSGIASNFDPKGYEIVHAVSDGQITFTFDSGDVVVNAMAGMDLAIHPQCLSITSSMDVWIA